MEIIIVSIGTLSKNPFWNEKQPVRTSHATTTLVRQEKSNLLVDPSLPLSALEPRLFERSGLRPADITHIFLTNWRPVHRRALASFPNAVWWVNQAEHEAAEAALAEALHRADGNPEAQRLIRDELSLLRKTTLAPDELLENIDLFPLPGYTPGQSGLLLTEPTRTTILAGDAVPTAAHFLAGQVFQESYDLDKAKDSLMEMYEIADLIIPGHDNLFPTPRTGM